MNEEELKKGCGKEIEENDKEVITCGNSLSYNGKLPNGRWKVFRFVLCPTCQARLEGFQKGKLEQKKEELEWLEDFMRGFKVDKNGFTDGFNTRFTDKRIKQLQKEIKVSGDSLTEFWDNPEDDRWDKEYNPDLLPETLKNKEEKQDED